MNRMCRIAHHLLVVLVSVAIAALAMLLSATAQPSDKIAQHFRGKTIRLMIATGTGGAYGGYGLVFAQHFGKHIPGDPTVVPEYRPGAGGVVAANYLYNVAPKDGTAIGLPLAPIVLAQYTGANVQYDASKFLWIGQMADITRMFAVWETTPIKTFQDLQTMESVAGTTGRGSETYMNPALMNHVFGTKIKIVSGYKGSNSLTLALERGEISAVSGTWSNFAANHPHWLSEKKVRFIVQIGLSKVKGYEQVPLLSELAKTEEDRRLVEYHVAGHDVGRLFDHRAARRAGPHHRRPAQRLRRHHEGPDISRCRQEMLRRSRSGNQEVVAAAVARATKAPKSLLERFIKAPVRDGDFTARALTGLASVVSTT